MLSSAARTVIPPSSTSPGFSVWITIAPAAALRPYSAPCGPLRISDLTQRALVLVELCGVGLENAVDHQRDRAFRVARAVDAANVDLGIARVGRAGDDGHARGQLDEIIGALHPGLGKGIRAEDRDRGRHVLQRFRLAAGGDDDGIVLFARLVGGRGGLLGIGRRGKEPWRQEPRQRQERYASSSRLS